MTIFLPILLKMMGVVAVLIGVVVIGVVICSQRRSEECQCDRCRTVREPDKP